MILEGTATSNPEDPSAAWEAYEFKCKPGKAIIIIINIIIDKQSSSSSIISSSPSLSLLSSTIIMIIKQPGKVDRAPCFISPYHYRLDWLMWFAAFQRYQQNPWMVRSDLYSSQFFRVSNLLFFLGSISLCIIEQKASSNFKLKGRC